MEGTYALWSRNASFAVILCLYRNPLYGGNRDAKKTRMRRPRKQPTETETVSLSETLSLKDYYTGLKMQAALILFSPCVRVVSIQRWHA
jgi:hypothetical protein